MSKEDPLHRLSRTQTSASRQQQYSVWKEAETGRKKDPHWKSPLKSSTTPHYAHDGHINHDDPAHNHTPMRLNYTSPKKKTTAKPRTIPAPSTSSTPAKENTSIPARTYSSTKKPKPVETSTNPCKKASARTPMKDAFVACSDDEDTSRSPSIPTTIITTLSSNVDDAGSKSSTTASASTDPSKLEFVDRSTAMTLFAELDENGSGKLSLAELDKGVGILYPATFNSKSAMMRAYKSADTSKDGFVERDEFESFLHYICYYNNLWQLFECIDTEDGNYSDHRISREEFMAFADKAGLDSISFDDIDADNGGKILFGELCQYMAKNHKDFASDEANVLDLKQRLAQLEQKKVKAIANYTSSSFKAAAAAADIVVPDAIKMIVIPEKEEALALFDQMDDNASGKLSLAELDKGVITLFRDQDFYHKPAIMAAYKASDRSGDGFIERKEFGYFLGYIVYYNNLWALFRAVDDDGDRRISKEEFLKAADKLEALSESAFDEIDGNGGGLILFDELCQWMAVNKSTWGADEGEVKEAITKIDGEEAAKATAQNEVVEPELIPEAVQKIYVPPKEEAMALFDALDPNGNGMLSLAEIDKGIVTSYPQFNQKPAIMAAYKASDRNGDGMIRRSEFEYFLRFIKDYTNLWHLFEGMDADGDRRISKDEFMAAKLGLSADDAAEAFDAMDESGGGMVLFDELCHWMAANKSDWAPGGIENEVV